MTRTLTLAEAAQVLKTTEERVSECIHNRALPAAKVGRNFVLIEDDVLAWLRTQYGNWKEASPCASTNAHQAASGGLTLARSPASALDAALAPRTAPQRRSTPPRLRQVFGVPSGSEKPRA